MAYCIPNSPSLQGWKTGPCCLFGWNIGKNRVNGKPQIKYHDIDLTFPTSLVDKTFLRGTTILFSISSSFKLVIKVLAKENLESITIYYYYDSSTKKNIKPRGSRRVVQLIGLVA